MQILYCNLIYEFHSSDDNYKDSFLHYSYLWVASKRSEDSLYSKDKSASLSRCEASVTFVCLRTLGTCYYPDFSAEILCIHFPSFISLFSTLRRDNSLEAVIQ